MFGFVRPALSELRVREAEAYRAFYCGVCKGLGGQCGPLCRILLQYDFALLALVLDMVYEEGAAFLPGRCSVNPLRKLPLAGGQAVRYACDAHGILLLGKALDDRRDGGPLRLLAAPLRGMTKKAALRQPTLHRALLALLRDQTAAECADAAPDEAAEPFATFCREMFAPPDVPPEAREALRWLGYNLGRWIYYADALEDLPRDRKKGRFNPLPQAARAEAARALLPQMHQCAEQALLALDLLPQRRHCEIARNVIELGLFATAQSVAEGSFAKGIDRKQQDRKRGEPS